MSQLNHTDTHLTHLLSSLSASTWQQQIDIIQALPVNSQIIKLISHRNFSSDFASLFASHNPRSKVITIITDYLLNLFSAHCNQLTSFANLLITNECLLRLLGNGNKVLSGSANQLLKCIISHTDFKSKGKQIKYVQNLEYQFLNSKNNYVREKISLYFLLISTSFYYQDRESLKDFQRRIVKSGLEDASDKVRKNMKEIMQNICEFEKENQFASLQTMPLKRAVEPNSQKYSQVNYPLKSRVSKVSSNILINQSSIRQNFSQQSLVIKPLKQQQMDERGFQFYLQRLRAGNDWSTKLVSYQALTEMINNQSLTTFKNQNLYCSAIKQLTPFLSEKRNRIYESCCEAFLEIISQIKEGNRTKAISCIHQNIADILTNAAKYQNSASKLFPAIIELSPAFCIPKMAEISLQTKVYKQKLLILEAIINCLSLFVDDHPRNKSNKKICCIIKIMCQHIDHSSNKQKELSLAALAIISHFKSKYPEDVLTTLLCQSDKVLTKIIDIAQSIDESLKTAVIDYISSLKSDSKKSCSVPSSKQSSFGQLQQQIRLISEHKQNSLSRLGELIFTQLEMLTPKQYIKILKLLQILINNDLLMEFTILLGQICKTSNKQIIDALIELLDGREVSNTQQLLEHHSIFMIQMLALSIKQWNRPNHRSICQQVGRALIKVYRRDQSLKKRNSIITALTNIPLDILEDFLTDKQLKLTRLYAHQLKEQTQQFDT